MQDWMKSTTIGALGGMVLAILALAVLLLPRKYATIPFLLLACFVAPGQNITIGGFSFYMMRILAYLAVLRVLARGETSAFRWTRIDVAVLVYAIYSSLIYTINYGSMGFTMKLGHISDGVLVYFVARCLIRDLPEIRSFAAVSVIVSLPVMLAFAFESATHRNMFSVFGGVPEFSEVREGKLRAQGAFAHSILAGCFWASILPLMVGLWWNGRLWRWASFIGIGCALAIIAFCASSTPIVGVVGGVIGVVLYKLRRHMRTICWGTVALLTFLHLIMQSPVWSLIQRVDIIGGSTGNFRYRLIDGAINNLNRWWLWGEHDPGVWGWGLRDVTNQFLLEGVRGGAISMILFIIVFGCAFKHIGRLWRAAANGSDRFLYWALGVALAVHCVNFMGVSYFGQIVTLLWIQVAMVASLIPVPMRKPVATRVSNAQRSSQGKHLVSRGRIAGMPI